MPGAVLDGPVLMEADLGYQIDNMEGLSVHRAANGDIVLTLVSDDNFSVIQRTHPAAIHAAGQVSTAPKTKWPGSSPAIRENPTCGDQLAAASFFATWRLISSAFGDRSSSLALARKASRPPR